MDARQLYRAVFNLSLSVQDLLDILQEEIQRGQKEQFRREHSKFADMPPLGEGVPLAPGTDEQQQSETHSQFGSQSVERVAEDSVSDNTVDSGEEISVSLLSARTGQVPEESQINIAFSRHYNAGQAMVYVPKSSWHFFPERNVPFMARTDDDRRLTLKVVGTSARSLVTTNSYRILNEYLRGRLGIGLDQRVTREMLEEYGRTDIVFRKVDGEYFLDFSP